MNIQVEHQDGHTAQLTIMVEPDKAQAAKQKAARSLAKKLRIPGFRPGKAPFHIVQKMAGEAALLEEALEGLADTYYKAALDESQIDPAAPGEIVDIAEESDGLRLVFRVPKAPTVNLGDYRAIRGELEVEPVTDEILNKAIETLRESHAVIEDVERAAKLGDEVELDLKVTWWHEGDHDHDHADHDHSEDEDHDHDHDHGEGEDHDHDHDHGEGEDHDHEHEAHSHESGHEHVLIDDRAAKIVVVETGNERDLLPGFSAEVVGLSADDEKEFSLTLPDDFEDEGLRGQTVDVTLKVVAVRNRTLPELNDTFAASATNGEQETLLDLRIKTRQDLEEGSKDAAENKLFETLFEQILENAEITYHQSSVDLYTTNILRNMDALLRERLNMGLNDYLRIMGQSEAQLREDRREDALKTLKRDLVIAELATTEQLSIAEADIEAEIEKAVESFGPQGAQFRQFFDTPESRQEIASRLLSRALVQRLVAIGTGQELPTVSEEEQSEE